jgi:hypothetical protein
MNANWLVLSASVVSALAATAGAGQGSEKIDPARAPWTAAQEPWTGNAKPGDVVKDHVELLTDGRHAYTVVQGGTIDGRSCRTPMGVGMNREGALEQTWESNRAVRIENVGDTDVINPWLSNGQNNFRTMKEIVESAVKPGMTDAEKAFAVWWQDCRHHYHGECDGVDGSDPVRIYNVYGCYQCGSNATELAALWREAGLEVAPSSGTLSHTTSRVFFDGRWSYLDGDQHCFFLLRDNATVASDQDLVRDHDLVKRAHTGGILLGDYRRIDETWAACYAHEEVLKGHRDGKHGTTMDMLLRPGESITWRWGHLSPPKYRGPNKPTYFNTLCNGLWEYKPDLTKDIWRRGAASAEGVRSTAEGLAAEPGKTGAIVWLMRSPYPFVGGRVEGQGSGARIEVSTDNKRWTEVSDGILDNVLPSTGGPWYEYCLRCQLQGDARLKALRIVNDLQMAVLAMPEMGVGENKFLYTDDSPNGRRVAVTHVWVERSSSQPPLPPTAAVYPADGGRSDGTDIVFSWERSIDPDGYAVTDYEFMLSQYPDIHRPFSTNFYRLISRTGDDGKAQYTLRSAGLLTPGTTYYWHVRAKDAEGVWGPWSRTWSFTADGPAYPLDVTLAYDAATRQGVLKWKPNPVGRPAVKYRIYGSDEKGFSVSDALYAVETGASKELKSPFPANFIMETTATELPVVGPDVSLPAANKAYYRVVAVDARGKRSGPSDYASAPRPVIYSAPATTVQAGEAYGYQVGAVRSIGDLRDRLVNGQYVASYWDVEHPAYALEKGPAWLKIDAATGLLSGTPDAAGKAEVVVTVTTDRVVRNLDPVSAGWGQEKLVSTGAERVGSDTQRFTINVSR